VHDLFDVLGLSRNAPAGEIRRVCARRFRRSHPDFRTRHPEGDTSVVLRANGDLAIPRDVAVDFVDVTTLLDRIELAFFSQQR
jgi:hypothetical protein